MILVVVADNKLVPHLFLDHLKHLTMIPVMETPYILDIRSFVVVWN